MHNEHYPAGCSDCDQISALLLQVNALLKELISKLPLPPVPHGTEALIETIWLLMTSVVAVPAICRLPGGSPVLGFLVRLSAWQV